jgi:hypothetical protein
VTGGVDHVLDGHRPQRRRRLERGRVAQLRRAATGGIQVLVAVQDQAENGEAAGDGAVAGMLGGVGLPSEREL